MNVRKISMDVYIIIEFTVCKYLEKVVIKCQCSMENIILIININVHIVT